MTSTTDKPSYQILSDQDTDKVLFSDQYFTVTRTKLIINYYYFLTRASKIIPLKEIASIHTGKELCLRWPEYKIDKPLNNVWYAMNWKQFFYNDACVVKVKGDLIRKGFTLIDENGLEILKEAWNDASISK